MMGTRFFNPKDMGPQLPTSALPEEARQYAERPYSPRMSEYKAYMLRKYENACSERNVDPWPARFDVLLSIAADMGKVHKHSTVHGMVRIIAAEERGRSGVELLGHLAMKQVLAGIQREHPREPVRPLPADQRAKLFAYEPQTASQIQTRSVLVTSYTAGLSLTEHVAIDVSMLEFIEEGVLIRELSPTRPRIFVGKALKDRDCPVRAIREAAARRSDGPLWRSPRSRRVDQGITYSGIAGEIRRYGALVGIERLSNEQLRRAGVLEQSRTIHPVQLAYFHGRKMLANADDRIRLRGRAPW